MLQHIARHDASLLALGVARDAIASLAAEPDAAGALRALPAAFASSSDAGFASEVIFRIADQLGALAALKTRVAYNNALRDAGYTTAQLVRLANNPYGGKARHNTCKDRGRSQPSRRRAAPKTYRASSCAAARLWPWGYRARRHRQHRSASQQRKGA